MNQLRHVLISLIGNMYKIIFSSKAKKDSIKIKNGHLKDKVEELLNIIANNPWQNPPPYEKLSGDLDRVYSRRINVQHRLLYQIIEDIRTIRIIRMWTHYE